MTDDALEALLRQVAHGDLDTWNAASKRLRKQGELAIPALIEVLEKELPNATQSGQPARRLGALLADFNDSRSLLILRKLAQTTGYGAPLDRVVRAMEQRASREDVVALVAYLEQVKLGGGALGSRYGHGKPIAELLIRLAQTRPEYHIELRAALPLLRSRLTSPLAFIGLHKRLMDALGEDNLPIPATPLQPTRDLPIPMEKEEANHDELSKPTGLSSAL